MSASETGQIDIGSGPWGEPQRVAAGHTLLSPDDVSSDVYLVEAGRLVVEVEHPDGGRVQVGTIDAGEVTGEMRALTGAKRSAHVRAEVDSTVRLAAGDAFLRWTLDDATGDTLAQAAADRINRTELLHLLETLLDQSDTRILQAIVDEVTWRHLAAGEVLFREGEPSHHAYIVVSGRLRVSTVDGDVTTSLGHIGRGEMVGELGLVDHGPRSATVTAQRDTTLAVLSGELFESLVGQHPSVLMAVTRRILQRLRSDRRPPDARIRGIAVVDLCETTPSELTIALETMASHQPTLHLSSDEVDSRLGRAGIANAPTGSPGVYRVEELLRDVELTDQVLVLSADDDLTPWSQRALHQADRVLLLTEPAPSTDRRRRLDRFCAVARDANCDIVHAVVHDAATARPIRARALLAESRPDHVVHVRRDAPDTWRRLGRLVSGNGVGLVLGGGGARGFAHLGVYRALRDHGVPIDAVGGCSMGAILGAAVAQDLAPDDLDELTVGIFERRILDYTVPIVSLVRGAKVWQSIHDVFGGWDIEDLWLPYHCVATNITTGELTVLRRGPVDVAVRASAALPGVLPPVALDGQLHVDGGVLDNLPIEPMHDSPLIGRLIAVDVAPQDGPEAPASVDVALSGVSAIRDAIRREGVPTLPTILVRTMLIGASQRQRAMFERTPVDLYLRLPLEDVSLLGLRRVRSVISAGHDIAAADIRAWAAGRPWEREPEREPEETTT